MSARLDSALARAEAWTYKDHTFEFSGFKFESRQKAIDGLLARFIPSWLFEAPVIETKSSTGRRGLEAMLITVTRDGVSHTLEAFTEVDGIGRYAFEVMDAEKMGDGGETLF